MHTHEYRPNLKHRKLNESLLPGHFKKHGIHVHSLFVFSQNFPIMFLARNAQKIISRAPIPSWSVVLVVKWCIHIAWRGRDHVRFLAKSTIAGNVLNVVPKMKRYVRGICYFIYASLWHFGLTERKVIVIQGIIKFCYFGPQLYLISFLWTFAWNCRSI